MSENQKISEEEELEKSKQFKEELSKFYNSHVKENFKCPIISGKELDLYKLYKEVTDRGGFQQVCETKQWKDVVSTLDLPASCTSASFTVKNHYNKYLSLYEKTYMKTSLNVSHNNINSQSNISIVEQTKNDIINNNHYNVNNNNNNNINNNISNQIQISTQPSREREETYLKKKIMRNDVDLNFFLGIH